MPSVEPPPGFLIPPGEPFVGELRMNRFELAEPVARGGQGMVWRAVDRLTSRPVAIKVIPRPVLPDAPGRGVRREVAALRLLRLPGVVPLLDVDERDGCLWIAMDWVAGSPFPGRPGRVAWEELEPTFAALLETLHRLHGLGIVHCDLKPSNVLVDDAGQPTVLDLGIASGESFAGVEPSAGTPRYMPPECEAGARSTPGRDLFAVGVMIFEALTGERLRPAEAEDGGQVASDWLAPARVRGRLQGVVPHEIAESIADLVEPDARRRTASAEDALHRFAGGTTTPDDLVASLVARRLGDGERVGRDALLELFDARERIFGDRSLAADVLFDATGGAIPAVRRELRRWLRLGIGTLGPDRVRIDARDARRLADRPRRSSGAARDGDGPEARLARAMGELRASTRGGDAGAPSGAARGELDADLDASVGAKLAAAARAARVAAEAAEDDDLLADLPVLVSLAGELGRADLVDDLFETWLVAAVGRTDRATLESLLHALERLGAASPVLRAVAGIAQAGLATLDGARARARELLGADPPLPSFRIAWSWHAIAQFIARALGCDAALVAMAKVRAWAASLDRPLPVVDVWDGWCHYVCGEFDRAVELHERAARHLGGKHRASALLAAARAAEFADRPEHAASLAERAARASRGRRDLYVAIQSACSLLSARYALGGDLELDAELAEALHECELPALAAPPLTTLAAIAWRRGDVETALQLAREGMETGRSSGRPGVFALAESLYLNLGGESRPPRELLQACDGAPAGITLQVAALIAMSGAALPSQSLPSLTNAWSVVRPRNLELRREVLSWRECVEALTAAGLDLAPCPEP